MTSFSEQCRFFISSDFVNTLISCFDERSHRLWMGFCEGVII